MTIPVPSEGRPRVLCDAAQAPALYGSHEYFSALGLRFAPVFIQRRPQPDGKAAERRRLARAAGGTGAGAAGRGAAGRGAGADGAEKFDERGRSQRLRRGNELLRRSRYLDRQPDGNGVTGSAQALWTLSNAGTISTAATSGNGVQFSASGSLINTGTIVGFGSLSTGVSLGTGSIDNAATSAVIAGGLIGIYTEGGSATLTNAGTIHGGGEGVDIGDRGNATVTNSAGGGITGGVDGVYVRDAYLALANDATIRGGTMGVYVNLGSATPPTTRISY